MRNIKRELVSWQRQSSRWFGPRHGRAVVAFWQSPRSGRELSWSVFWGRRSVCGTSAAKPGCEFASCHDGFSGANLGREGRFCTSRLSHSLSGTQYSQLYWTIIST